MQLSVTETEWPEITLRHPDWDKKNVGAPTSASSAEALRIKAKILDNYSGSILTHLKPGECFRADLFGNFVFRSPRFDWINEEGITEREERLLRLFFQELLEELKGKVVWDSELFYLCSAFLLCEERIQEYKELLDSFAEGLEEAKEGRRLLFYLGLLSQGEIPKYEGKDLKEKIAYAHKTRGLNPEEQNELFDKVVSSEANSLLGLAFHYFREKTTGLRNVSVLETMIARKIRAFKAPEREVFLRQYEVRHSIWDRFFLIKKIQPRDKVAEWVRNEKKRNGREELSETLRDSIQEGTDESLYERFRILKEQGLAHTLRPFELLVIWNSTLASDLDAELLGLRSQTVSYLGERALAVQAFKDKKFEVFQERSLSTGRFQYSPEMIYLKAISFLETGKVEEGVRLMESLVYKFPQSDFLRLVLDRYRKKS